MTLTAISVNSTKLTLDEVETLTGQIAERLTPWIDSLQGDTRQKVLAGITPVIETEGLSLWCGLTMSRNGKGPDPYRIRGLVKKMDSDLRQQSLVRDAIRRAVVDYRRNLDGGTPTWETPKTEDTPTPVDVDQMPPRPRQRVVTLSDLDDVSRSA